MINRCKMLSLLIAVLAFALVSVGCSNSDSNDNIVNYAKIKVHYDELPEDVESLYFALYNRAGMCIWGPAEVDVSTHPDMVSLYQVPIRCVSMAVAGYDEKAEKAKYFATQTVELTAGETVDLEDFKLDSIDKVDPLYYAVEHDVRAHTGDNIGLQALAAFGTAEKHYWQDLSAFSTWSVSTANRLSSEDTNGNSLKKGQYRCLSTVDDNVVVSAELGNNQGEATVDITNATIVNAGIYTDLRDIGLDTDGEVSRTVAIPTGADFRLFWFVATWSDGEYSLLNTCADWNNDDSVGYIAPNKGRITGVGNIEEDKEDVTIETIGAEYTSNGKKFTDNCHITVVDAKLTGLAAYCLDSEVEVGDYVNLVVEGVYGPSGLSIPVYSFTYTLSSDDTSIIDVDEDGALIAKAAGTAKITATSEVKKSYTAYCEVTVSEDESASADDEPVEE